MRILPRLAPGLLLVCCGGRNTLGSPGAGAGTPSCDVPLHADGNNPHSCSRYAAAVTSDDAAIVSEGCVEYDMGTVVEA